MEAELGAGGAVPFAMLLNAHVRDAMPLIHLGASVALGGAAVLVAASLAALLCAVLGVAAFINESPPAILRVGLAATAAASLLLLLGWSNPFPAAVGCFGALVLLGAWRVLVCGFGQLRAAPPPFSTTPAAPRQHSASAFLLERLQVCQGGPCFPGGLACSSMSPRLQPGPMGPLERSLVRTLARVGARLDGGARYAQAHALGVTPSAGTAGAHTIFAERESTA